MIPRLFAAVFLVTACCVVSIDAQTKKDTKTTTSPGTVEIYKNKEGEYRYRVKGPDGKTIAIPLAQMSWATKPEVMKAISDLKAILNTTPVEVKDGIDTKSKTEEPKKATVEKKKAS